MDIRNQDRNNMSTTSYGGCREEFRAMTEYNHYYFGTSNPIHIEFAKHGLEGEEINYNLAYVSIMSFDVELPNLPNALDYKDCLLLLVSQNVFGMFTDKGEPSADLIGVKGDRDERGIIHYKFKECIEDAYTYRTQGSYADMGFVLLTKNGERIPLTLIHPINIVLKVYVPRVSMIL